MSRRLVGACQVRPFNQMIISAASAAIMTAGAFTTCEQSSVVTAVEVFSFLYFSFFSKNSFPSSSSDHCLLTLPQEVDNKKLQLLVADSADSAVAWKLLNDEVEEVVYQEKVSEDVREVQGDNT